VTAALAFNGSPDISVVDEAARLIGQTPSPEIREMLLGFPLPKLTDPAFPNHRRSIQEKEDDTHHGSAAVHPGLAASGPCPARVVGRMGLSGGPQLERTVAAISRRKNR